MKLLGPLMFQQILKDLKFVWQRHAQLQTAVKPTLVTASAAQQFVLRQLVCTAHLLAAHVDQEQHARLPTAPPKIQKTASVERPEHWASATR